VKVRELQARLADLYLEKDRRRGVEGTYLWLVEEVGELSVAIRDKDFFATREELADVLAWTASVANILGIDLEDAFNEKYPDRCLRCGAKPCRCPE